MRGDNMIDLNDFLSVIKSGRVSKDKITVVRKNGKIVDYVLPEEHVSATETTEVMHLEEVLSEIFGLC